MMEREPYKWDFFLSHAGGDTPTAEALYDLLHERARVFLDSRCLLEGDDWALELSAAQQSARVTLVLISSSTDEAYYQREEIAAALDLARRNKQHHRVVPIYIDVQRYEHAPIPFGLRLKHALWVEQAGGLPGVADELCDLLDTLRQRDTEAVQRAQAEAPAVSKVVEGHGTQRLSGLLELTPLYALLVKVLVALLPVLLVMIIACLALPAFASVRSLSTSVFATIFVLVLGCLTFIVSKTIGEARVRQQVRLSYG